MAEVSQQADPFQDLDSWVRTTLPRAVAYARSLLRDRSLADDLVHDCFVRLIRKRDVYDLKQDGVKLLFRAVTHACFNHNSRERQHFSLDRVGLHDDRPIEVEDTRMNAPSQPLLDLELESVVASGLADLPPTQKAALELKALGHSLQEIAETLKVSASNAGVLVHRARQAMAQRLAPYLEEPSR